MGRSDDNAVGTFRVGAGDTTREFGVVGKDGVRHCRGWGVAPAVVDKHSNIVSQQHLKRRYHRGFGKRMGVAADEDGAVDALLRAVIHNRLGGGVNVVFIERGIKGGTAVPGCSKSDLLVGVFYIGNACVIGGDHLGDVDEVPIFRHKTCTFMCHNCLLNKTRTINDAS